ncbi:MAG: DUF1853 family protein [Agarilytica sp.]
MTETSQYDATASPWLQYRHAIVRDLAWLLQSPQLFVHDLGGFPAYFIAEEKLTTPLEEWLHKIDSAPSEYLNIRGETISRQKFRRLGIYCETLLEFFFTQAPWRKDEGPIDVIRNFRVQGKTQTIGECDFVLPYLSGIAEHIELAVKFFLQHPYAERAWNAWRGPNAIDRLDIKLNRMIDHQLPLPQRDEARELFTEFSDQYKITSALQTHHLIKGMLFSHTQDESSGFRGPKNSNEHLLHGEWMRISEFLDYEHNNLGECILCDKMDWLTGPENMEESLGLDEVTEKMRDVYSRAYENKLSPPGLMLIMFDDASPRHDNLKRVMIVPDHWPEINSPLRNM